jgi:predicted transcriptional regulator
MTDDFELRDIDHAVLHHIADGHNDTQKITQQTTLKTHRIRYSLKKLEQQGLITIEKPDTMVERVINGQKRVFQHPKQADITEKGHRYIKQEETDRTDAYRDLSHDELVKKFRELEEKVNQLEQSIEAFRRQIINKLEEG